MPHVTGVILAAGKGVRMRSRLPKVMHSVAGMPMVSHVIKSARESGVEDLVLVVGHGREMLMERLADSEVRFVLQEQQLGTGHALLQAEEAASDTDLVLVLCGDTPLIKPSTLSSLVAYHLENKAAATVLTTVVDQPYGYGRIIRDERGNLLRIVEEKDASTEEKAVKEINSGMYCFDKQVFDILKNIKPENAQGEYYLTDALILLRQKGEEVLALPAADEEDIYGINDRLQMAAAERILRQRKIEELMLAGVTVVDPSSTFVDVDVEVGMDSIIYPFTILEGYTQIGEECRIGPGTRVTDSRIGRGVAIESSKVVEATIGDGCVIGPFSYLRPETVLGANVKVGDFVEIKKSNIGPGSKVPHLSYVGDATVGRDVNIGAGTITCNYDGEKKHVSIIESGAFIGSNTNLVAPVKIGEGAVTGAGSTITQDIPPFSLGVERAPQKVINDWKKRKSTKKHE
ncbi:MAG: bifunctional UDP-N-acetylglucosamine diphosphorylase/glucosamine-1-phosphate N-acetyltransferase GlmU [Candidatus Saccharibacteria bacterium]